MKTTRKFYALLLTFSLLLTVFQLAGLTAFAADSDTGVAGEFQYTVLDEEKKTCSITKYTGQMLYLYIPEDLNGYTVVEIGDSAFFRASSIIEVEIPYTVTHIGNSVFTDCAALEAIHVAKDNPAYISQDGILFNKDKTELIRYPEQKDGESYNIPDSVTTIADDAFRGCDRLKDISIPSGVERIGAGAFILCYSLDSVHIPESVTEIGFQAFSSCSSLREFEVAQGNSFYTSQDGVLFNKDKTVLIRYPETKADPTYCIPESVITVEASAFSGNQFLSTVKIPDGVTTLGESVFHGDSALTSIVLPESVTDLGAYAFFGCRALTSVTLSNGITALEVSTFGRCTSLTGIRLPNHLQSIGERTFDGCRALKHVTVPNTVKSIGDFAFEDCDALTSIVIPQSVTDLGHEIFFYCEAQTIYGFTGSAAQAYADQYNIPFVDVGSLSDSPAYSVSVLADGDKVTVTVSLSADANAADSDFALQYDNSKLDFVTTRAKADWVSVEPRTQENAVYLNFSNAPAIAEDSVLWEIEFRRTGSATVGAADFSVLNYAIFNTSSELTAYGESVSAPILFSCTHAQTAEEIRKQPTHAEPGETATICTVCGETLKTDSIPKLESTNTPETDVPDNTKPDSGTPVPVPEIPKTGSDSFGNAFSSLMMLSVTAGIFAYYATKKRKAK